MTIVLTSKGHEWVRVEKKFNFGNDIDPEHWTYRVRTSMFPTNGFAITPPITEFLDFSMAYELYKKLVEKLLNEYK